MPVSQSQTGTGGGGGGNVTVVAGQGAPGAAPGGNPVLVAGFDGTNVRDLLVDASGRLQIAAINGAVDVSDRIGRLLGIVQGAAAAGSAVSGNPVLMGGTDGANARDLLVDASGRPLIVGAAAAGSAAAGNPVLMGGTDGANARAVLLDANGREIVTGAAAAGSAVAGNPVLVGGSDGTNARAVSLDTAGREIVTTHSQSASVDHTGAAINLLYAQVNITTATITTVIAAPGAGFAIRVISYALVSTAAQNVTLVGTGTNIVYGLTANGGVSFAGSLWGPAFQCSAATAFQITTSAATQLGGHIAYIIV